MAKAALIEHRPWLLASVAAGIAYYFLSDNPVPGLYMILLKGSGLALLAIYALRRAICFDGKLLAGVFAFSSMADMALELDFMIGGALFAVSHILACILYLKNRRENPTQSQMLLGAVLLVAAPAISYLLSGDLLIGIYAITLGAMAATAWTSRFPRYRVGIGAVLFVISDWLIFSRMGPLDLAPVPDLLIWPLYFGGQVMIATGVVQTLRGERAAV